jgi:hypothetical protein
MDESRGLAYKRLASLLAPHSSSVVLRTGKLGGSLLRLRNRGPIPRPNVKNMYECHEPG